MKRRKTSHKKSRKNTHTKNRRMKRTKNKKSRKKSRKRTMYGGSGESPEMARFQERLKKVEA